MNEYGGKYTSRALGMKADGVIPKKPGVIYARPGITRQKEALEIAARKKARMDASSGFVTRRVFDPTSILVSDKAIIVLFYDEAEPFWLNASGYRSIWNEIADEQEKRREVDMVVMTRRQVETQIDRTNCSFIGGKYFSAYPCVRLFFGGKFIRDLVAPCRADDGMTPFDRLKKFARDAVAEFSVHPSKDSQDI